MKRIKNIVLVFIVILIIPTFCFADDEEKDEENNFPELIEAVSRSSEEPNLNSRAAIIYDRNSKQIIYGKNENEQKKMASTTKIMTAIIVIENGNLNDTVIVSKKAAGTGGSRVGLKVGDKITVNDLLYGLMLCSGNDAAVALAEYVGGSVEGFADMMNKKALELNLVSTHYITPHGLDNEEHFTSAYELAYLTDYALENNTFKNIVGTKNCTIYINGAAKNLGNTNELLGNFDGVYGVKTGFTNGANRCLVTSCKRNNMDIITVVLGADTKKFRTQDSIKLINYAFDNYEDIDVKEKIEKDFNIWKQENEKKIYINKGLRNNIKLQLDIPNTTYITVKKTQHEDIKTTINSLYYIDAPVYKNDIIGNMFVKFGDEEKLIINIISEETVHKKRVIDYMNIFFKGYLNYKKASI